MVLEKVFRAENTGQVDSREILTKEGKLIPGPSNSIGGGEFFIGNSLWLWTLWDSIYTKPCIKGNGLP